MRLDQSSMDIATLVDKILRREIDLQPDFQRGQVWSDSKRKRLVDTILRAWYVPAVHIVVNDELDREEVLDGQQRLRAIIDFMDDQFSIDGTLEPEDDAIKLLHGLRYSKLPDSVKSRFRRFTINTVRLREYRPEEPGELFFRLNQLTALTAAEQRNALIGEPRNQIRRLSEEFESYLQGQSIGFSNARMNFDDTLSRLAVALETGNIHDKVTANRLEKRYREGRGFGPKVIDTVSRSLECVGRIITSEEYIPKLNRASLFSWLFLLTENNFLLEEDNYPFVRDFLLSFETARNVNSGIFLIVNNSIPQIYYLMARTAATSVCMEIFNDRSSSRVNDVSSVLLRDLCLNACLYTTAPAHIRNARTLRLRSSALEAALDRLAKMPADVSERSVAEASLAKQWEARRAAS